MSTFPQLLTEVLAAPPVTSGGVAHKRTASRKDPDDKRPYEGTPTSPWPACKCFGEVTHG